jgi:alkylhydroperoxidase/carboxymuconolactone decarboxylase family protein YurZ
MKESVMAEDPRRARRMRELEELFAPEYDATNMPAADKRAAYALEHIAYRMGKLDQKINEVIIALAALATKG